MTPSRARLTSLVRAGIVALVAGSCAESREVTFSPEGDRATIARVTGVWSADDDADVSLSLCEDAERSFCEIDECSAKPCHDVGRSKAPRRIGFETTDVGCDCYGCECFDVRAGLPLRGAIGHADGTVEPVRGFAFLASGSGTSAAVLGLALEGVDPWEGTLEAGELTLRRVAEEPEDASTSLDGRALASPAAGARLPAEVVFHEATDAAPVCAP